MHTARVRGLLLLFFFLGVLHCTCSQTRSSRHGSQSNPSINGDIQSLLTAMQRSNLSLAGESHPFGPYIPTTPSPENINCYVEIVPPTRVGGVCKNMGHLNRRRGRNNRRRMQTIWACQAGVHLEMGHPACGRNQNRRSQNRNG
ncbi:uncharacterized protein LOC143291847 [Babylonia areolata]|uniref:uncharacterized protein LOC143291847 n=1 Tax=Babylonia areolata TaxID=304850 RepID=UPI003FD24D1E